MAAPTYSAPGSMAAYDDLCQALEAWREAEEADALEAQARLTACAINCGMAPDEPAPLNWIRRRVRTYRGEVSATATSLATMQPLFAALSGLGARA